MIQAEGYLEYCPKRQGRDKWRRSTWISVRGSVKDSRKSGDERRFLLGEDGPQIEDEAVFLHASDDRDACRSATEALLELGCGIPGAGDANEFRRQRLLRRGAAARKRFALNNIDLHFIERKFGPQFAQQVIRAPLYFLGAGANHAQRGNFMPGRAQVRAERGFKRGRCQLVHAQRAEEGMTPNARDQLFRSSDDSRLRASQELVTAESHKRHACFDAPPHYRLADSAFGEIDQ